MVDFWCRFLHGLRRSGSRFIRDINGEKKNLVIDDFFTVSFSRFAPSRIKGSMINASPGPEGSL